MNSSINSRSDGYLYLKIAGIIEQQIVNKVLKSGDKLPSLRTISKIHGVSQSTALKVYYLLESKSMIEARPKSGYFVCYSVVQLAGPSATFPSNNKNEISEDLISQVYNDMGNEKTTMLSLVVPAPELLPIAKLNKGLVEAMRNLKGCGTSYEPVQGNEKLRRQIARWSLSMEAPISDQDLITTHGCINAISLCLTALTTKGDTIIVESPVFFGVLQLAKSLGLNVLELPTHPQTGIELDALKSVLIKHKVKVCLLISNFSNPLGSCMPDEHKKETVRLLEKHNIPLIEDDIYGDIYFGRHRPKSCKSFDESGLVLWCSSVSKTLAPGYRVGWVAPGKFKEQILHLKKYHMMSSTSITQEVVANFLETGRYEHHLRKLRLTLYTNYLKYVNAIRNYFPENTLVSRPQGGFAMWLELTNGINTADLYKTAIKQNISIAPGRMFTLQNQYNNCLRLNYSLQWNDQLNSKFKILGRLSSKN